MASAPPPPPPPPPSLPLLSTSVGKNKCIINKKKFIAKTVEPTWKKRIHYQHLEISTCCVYVKSMVGYIEPTWKDKSRHNYAGVSDKELKAGHI